MPASSVPTTPSVSLAAASAAAAPAAAAAPPAPPVRHEEMLQIDPKYCDRLRHAHSMKSAQPQPISREQLPVPGARAFVLHDVMTEKECSHYVKETEELQYRDLAGEFEPDYRSNQRILVLSPKLADSIWARLAPQLQRDDVFRIKPMGHGNMGTWLPYRLNECIKMGKYVTGGHFNSHIDGPWSGQGEGKRSKRVGIDIHSAICSRSCLLQGAS